MGFTHFKIDNRFKQIMSKMILSLQTAQNKRIAQKKETVHQIKNIEHIKNQLKKSAKFSDGFFISADSFPLKIDEKSTKPANEKYKFTNQMHENINLLQEFEMKTLFKFSSK